MTAFDAPVFAIVVILAVIILRAWLWHRRDLRDLMDTGDGQGGVPPLPRREPPPVVHPAFEDWLAHGRCIWCKPGNRWIQPRDRCVCDQFCGAGHCLYDLQEQLYGGER